MNRELLRSSQISCGFPINPGWQTQMARCLLTLQSARIPHESVKHGFSHFSLMHARLEGQSGSTKHSGWGAEREISCRKKSVLDIILSCGSPLVWLKLLFTYVSLERHTRTTTIIYPSKIAALTWSTVSVSISNETIRTCALRLMVNDPAGGIPCTRVMHNARVNTLSVLTCIEGRAILIPCASIVNLRWCGW